MGFLEGCDDGYLLSCDEGRIDGYVDGDHMVVQMVPVMVQWSVGCWDDWRVAFSSLKFIFVEELYKVIIE